MHKTLCILGKQYCLGTAISGLFGVTALPDGSCGGIAKVSALGEGGKWLGELESPSTEEVVQTCVWQSSRPVTCISHVTGTLCQSENAQNGARPRYSYVNKAS